MDGNGRWAVSKGQERSYGYRYGAEAFTRLVKDFIYLPVSVLTVYAFSTENNTRNKDEVSNIYKVIACFLLKDILPICEQNDLTLRFIGDRDGLPDEVKDAVLKSDRVGKNKTVVIALNYGGLDEVRRAYARLFDKNKKNITEIDIIENLDTAGLPPVDAVLRYGGHKRLSNFLPLQTTYAELFFTDKFFPDYDRKDVERILIDFEKIKRNFGGTDA